MAKQRAMVSPGADSDTDLYTAEADGLANFVICNRGSTAGTVRLWISDGTTANEDYILYDTPVGANEPFEVTVGAVMKNGDVARVRASTADFSFRISYIED